ncbi:MAG: hypothetical protein ACK5M3_09240 [Dysgonomonas sp.]
MGYTLKLDINYFTLKKIKEETTRRIRGEERVAYLTEKDECILKDFVNTLSIEEIDEANYMKVFLEDFINGFNSSFKPNKNNTQAMSVTTDQFKGYDSNDYTVWGIFKGGATGIEYDIYQSSNATIPTSKVAGDSVTSLYYFYKIWMPIDSNVGILMVQSYTNTGCTTLFKEQLSSYFIAKGYKAEWSKCIPDEYIDRFLKDGYISEIQVVHRNRDTNRPLNPVFNPFTHAKRRSIFSRFKIPFKDFISVVNYKNVLKSQIKAIDTDYDETQDKVKLFYVDSEGKRANATLANIDSILPTITLDDSLKEDNSQLPKWDDLHQYTKGMLNDIKRQISYTPKLR